METDRQSLKLAIILLAWNDQDGVIKLLNQFYMDLTPEMAIWIVDNQSDSPLTLPVGFPTVQVVRASTNLGYAGGINLGIQEVMPHAPEFLLLLNNDITIDFRAIQELVYFMETNPKIAITGPVLVENDRKLFGGRNIGKFLHTRRTSDSLPMDNHFYIPGTVFLFRSNLIKTIGLLDVRYFFSGEIADFCHRVALNGNDIRLNSKVEVCHKTTLSAGKYRSTLYRYYSLRNRFLYLRKHRSRKWSYLQFYWVWVGLRQIGGFLYLGSAVEARAVFWALWDGIWGQYGNRNQRFNIF